MNIISVIAWFLGAVMWITFLRHTLQEKKVRHRVGCAAVFAAAGVGTFVPYIAMPESEMLLLIVSLVLSIALTLWRFSGSVLRRIVFAALPITLFSLSGLFADCVAQFSAADSHVITTAITMLLGWALIGTAKTYFSPTKAVHGVTQSTLLLTSVGLSQFLYVLLRAAASFGVSQTAVCFLCLTAFGLITVNAIWYHMLALQHQTVRTELEEQLLQQQKNDQLRFDELKYQIETLKKAKHDFNNTLQVVRRLNNERKPAQVEAYLASYLDATRASNAYVTTNSDYINAIVNIKSAEARKLGIMVDNVIAAEIGAFTPVDCSNIIGNLFDNAIEACKKVKDHPRICFRLFTEGDATVLTMQNSIAASVLAFNPQLETAKTDSANHGFGTKIIRETAEKYHGYADFYEERGEFCCRVVLYL